MTKVATVHIPAHDESTLRCPKVRYLGHFDEMGISAAQYGTIEVSLKTCSECEHHRGIVDGEVTCDWPKAALRKAVIDSCNALSLAASTSAYYKEPRPVPPNLQTMDEEELRRTYDALETDQGRRKLVSERRYSLPQYTGIPWRPSDGVVPREKTR